MKKINVGIKIRKTMNRVLFILAITILKVLIIKSLNNNHYLNRYCYANTWNVICVTTLEYKDKCMMNFFLLYLV